MEFFSHKEGILSEFIIYEGQTLQTGDIIAFNSLEKHRNA